MTVIIGLEIHCQLNTQTKLFCGCSTDYREDGPNTHVCPVCLGLPGSLPITNRQAVIYALRVAKALHCEVPEVSEFARKNYFYPDLAKAYQITQYDKPLAVGGYIDIEGEDGGEKRIQLTRIHMEEDPGRLLHMGSGDRGRYTLVDYNRSGVPLIEIVTEPELSSPKEARRFLNKLRATLEYLGTFDSEKEGSLRVDANISIKGHERVEVKNITSYKGVEKALMFEITRQKGMIRRNATIVRETRHYQEARGVTTSARSKEFEHDYRYFPEPDLALLRVSSWVDEITLPELPDARLDRFMKDYGLSKNHARTLTGDLRLADFFEEVCTGIPEIAAPWTADILLGELNYRDMPISKVPVQAFRSLLMEVKKASVTDKSAVEVLRLMLNQVMDGTPPEMADEIIARLGLAKEEGDSIVEIVTSVLAEHEAAVADHRAGKPGAINFLVGQVMKATRGRADPKEIGRIIGDLLKE
ncbi:MAG: Asp-tRNA(Asn)/Glu-tRNA(Gln) amidotransferase subunit GatB [Methanocalculus sp. MSAO_Arc1]|uniref:Asp-tRNA(Asn)/Glu-tRNA(Gln) amidotransferase subunit GatB n=1 Tax=Methanocalculus TaxID=71151 RepID=UPI000FF00FDF|nr:MULTISPECIES: Asp-tRNA(Asn)/Glu-tRNA(Gln) amidotransferase subunit GatB [unclassified Methanocalculus]MCP1661904.1 aspartyl-tRNA(Asn)/glutamyl-tRNA(Gln) amidotransferase subunit B [Methanocalculus sp. AMF5]RQD81210.1 MAG: Asp-tRNA(Asn)/Glu-tRNA(Gln) amidotransferase subunit GatB [Methanocalculus sp. MSAO_Arc1]